MMMMMMMWYGCHARVTPTTKCPRLPVIRVPHHQYRLQATAAPAWAVGPLALRPYAVVAVAVAAKRGDGQAALGKLEMWHCETETAVGGAVADAPGDCCGQSWIATPRSSTRETATCRRSRIEETPASQWYRPRSVPPLPLSSVCLVRDYLCRCHRCLQRWYAGLGVVGLAISIIGQM